MITDDPGSPEIMCHLCEINAKLYKCPACSMITCSLKCCKEHKALKKCDGKRKRADYVELGKFTEQHLRSDFHFLEDVLQIRNNSGRIISETKGNAKKKSRVSNLHTISNDMAPQILTDHPPSVKKLVTAAKDRKTTVLIMPQGMTKRKTNCSAYHAKIDKIFWKVHIVFLMSQDFDMKDMLSPNLDSTKEFTIMGTPVASMLGTSVNRVDEMKTVESLLENHFFQIQQGNELIRHALRPLRLKKDSLRCLLQILPSSASAPRFHEVPLSFTVRDALADKVVIEYPTLFIGPVDVTSSLLTLISDISDKDSATAACSSEVGDQDKDSSSPSVDCTREQTKQPLPTASVTGEKRLRPEVGDEEEEGEESEEDDNDEPLGEDELAFLASLQKDLENADVETLKALISATESELIQELEEENEVGDQEIVVHNDIR